MNARADLMWCVFREFACCVCCVCLRHLLPYSYLNSYSIKIRVEV